MEEKEPVNGSEGGGGVKPVEEHSRGGSEGSQESSSHMSNTEGIRESVESMVSPSLNRLINTDAKDESALNPELNPELIAKMIAKNKKRVKARERKKAKRDKAIKDRMKLKHDDHEDDDSDEDSTVISSSSNDSRMQARIRELEAKIKAMEAIPKVTRRQSVAATGADMNSRMIYSMPEVAEDEKLKLANGHTLIELFMRIDDARIIGRDTQTLAYLGVDVKNALLLFLSQGNAKEAGWHSHEFSEIRDLNSLSDLDIQNLLILMVRPNEKGMLVRILNNIKVPLSPTTAGKPLYLALRPILRGVLSYLQLYEKLYRMLSGEQGVLVNGKTIGEDPNMVIELTKKVKGSDKYLDSHEAILKNTLVNSGLIPIKFFDNLKASEDRGITNYLLSAVQSIGRIHPREETTSFPKVKIKPAKEARYTQVMQFADRPGKFGQVMIETMKYNINLCLIIYDKLVMPFYAMMQTEQIDSKSRNVASMMGYILSNDDDDEEREVLVDNIMSDGYADDYENRICHLEEQLAHANEEAAIATRNFNELNAARNNELWYAANNPGDGRYPVKIATGATSSLRKPVTILTKKPCFAEARKEGSCSYGGNCKYSHDKRELEKVRNDPKAYQNMQVLSVLAEHSPEVYESKAAEFSRQY
jgi:hypothetical protein